MGHCRGVFSGETAGALLSVGAAAGGGRGSGAALHKTRCSQWSQNMTDISDLLT